MASDPSPPSSDAPAPDADLEAHPKPRPEGEPAEIVAVREMIETELARLVDRYAAQDGNYVLGYKSARVFVRPAQLEKGAGVIRVFAITNLDVPVTAELTSYLVTQNLSFVFGGFALDSDHGAVWFNHNLLAEYAAPEEIGATIVAIAETADHFDDTIKERFGGRLYIETPDEAVPPPTTPGYL